MLKLSACNFQLSLDLSWFTDGTITAFSHWFFYFHPIFCQIILLFYSYQTYEGFNPAVTN